jgi:predicted methyltransferase
MDQAVVVASTLDATSVAVQLLPDQVQNLKSLSSPLLGKCLYNRRMRKFPILPQGSQSAGQEIVRLVFAGGREAVVTGCTDAREMLMMTKSISLLTLFAVLAAPALALGVRPDADIARDAARKPADMIAFAHVVPGAKVVDIMAGGGYFTRVFSNAVGSGGHVTAIVPPSSAERDPVSAKSITDLASDASYGNISVLPGLNDPSLSGNIDVAWTSQNYHDLHNFLPPEGVMGFNKAVFAILKPGGIYVVLDHAAVAGSGTAATNTLHRIDPAVVKAEVVAAGFVFDGESKVLANPADAHTALVFDPSIRGKTDQFVYRFRKP